MENLGDSEHDYAERTSRNVGLLTAMEQDLLRQARFVIAGCGSTGGAVIAPLARAGARRFVLLDPGTYELNNLNRQDAFRADIGRNKAQVQAERLRDIDPFCEVEVHPEGALPNTLPAVLQKGDLIVDAIDVTTPEGIEAKRALHEAACTLRLPVVTAYDIATTQYLEVFDYRSLREPFAGRVARTADGDKLLRALVPASALPRRIFTVLVGRKANPALPFPQLAMTSALLGGLIGPVVLRILSDSPVRSPLRVDLDELVRPMPHALGLRLRTIASLPVLWWRMR
jgi:tRNA threonylcarbamoyladenosine dehydratase